MTQDEKKPIDHAAIELKLWERIADLEHERDLLRLEVERLRKLIIDDWK
jgi:hypothetical protein